MKIIIEVQGKLAKATIDYGRRASFHAIHGFDMADAYTMISRWVDEEKVRDREWLAANRITKPSRGEIISPMCVAYESPQSSLLDVSRALDRQVAAASPISTSISISDELVPVRLPRA